MKKIIIDQLGREQLRALIVMQPYVGQASCVVVKSAFGFAIDSETLA
jgi:hypothetical protein